MFRPKYIFLRLFACATGFIVAQSVWADEPASAPASAPDTSSTPTLNAPVPVLRPVPVPDEKSASASPAQNAPEATAVAGDSTASVPPTSSATAAAPAPAVAPDLVASVALTPPAVAERVAPGVATDSLAANSPAPIVAGAASAPATPSQNVTINLINLMVKRNLLTKEDAADLIKQAEQEADAARAQARAAEAAAQKVDLVADQAQKAALAAATATPAPSNEEEVRVPYVPEVVKNQIRDEVTQDVLKQDREEHLVKNDTTPDWVKHFRVAGDIRVRYESDMYPSGNSPGEIDNFNAIDTSSTPLKLVDNNGLVSLSPDTVVPTYNVDQNRDRLRFRARIGAEVDLGQNFTAGLRIGSGSDNQPVSQNQTLGGVNGGQGGDFSKYSVWFDRAFIRYEMGDNTDKYHLSMSVGRFDNPFMSTSMIWADDIGFDGAVVQAKYKVADGVTPFITGGAFPVFNTDLNFGTNALSTSAFGDAYNSYDKWLYAGQIGTTWKINKDFDFKGAVAFYDFQNIEGQVSPPISQDSAQFPGFVGPTDDSRPAFAQKGNTYIYLRDITPDPALAGGPVYQYLGLATPFREIAVTGQLDFNRFDPCHIWLVGEFVKNLAFDKTAIENNGPANLQGPVNNIANGTFNGGDTGYNIRLNVGKVSLEKLWDWNVSMTYRYLESDAVVDGFNDSDFGGGGANLKGYIMGANLAFNSRVWTGFRWMSADSIAGPPFKEDLFQFDINAKF
jgi:hypothetical protein